MPCLERSPLHAQTEAEADENEIELGTEEGEGGEGGLGGSSDGEEGMTAAEARRRAAAKKTKKDRNKWVGAVGRSRDLESKGP